MSSFCTVVSQREPDECEGRAADHAVSFHFVIFYVHHGSVFFIL